MIELCNISGCWCTIGWSNTLKPIPENMAPYTTHPILFKYLQPIMPTPMRGCLSEVQNLIWVQHSSFSCSINGLVWDSMALTPSIRLIHGYAILNYIGLYNRIPLYIDGLAQDCSNSIANALELLQSCVKPSICTTLNLLLNDQCKVTHIWIWDCITISHWPFSTYTLIEIQYVPDCENTVVIDIICHAVNILIWK